MSEILAFLAGRAGRAFGHRAERVMPATVGASLAAAVLLAGWLVAIGLLLAAAVWAIGGEIAWALLPMAAGAVLCVVLARFGGRILRRRAATEHSDHASLM